MAVASVSCLLLPFKFATVSVAASASLPISHSPHSQMEVAQSIRLQRELGRRRKRRILNKSRKSEVRTTRMKKVLEALEELKKKSGAQAEVLPIEKLNAEVLWN